MFSAFTPLAGGRVGAHTFDRAPIKTDAELNFTRQATGFALMPYPQAIGQVSGILHLFDDAEYSMMLGPNQNGPWTGAIFNAGAVFPNLSGGLVKVTG
jgi:hypothetical protein